MKVFVFQPDSQSDDENNNNKQDNYLWAWNNYKSLN